MRFTVMLAAVPFILTAGCSRQTEYLSIWACNPAPAPGGDPRFFGEFGRGRGISISEDARTGNPPIWTANGHLDDRVHRVADQPFPVTNSGNLDHPKLIWKIHDLSISANIVWSSSRRDGGSISLTAKGAQLPLEPGSDGFERQVRMSGACVRDSISESRLNR
jgi:hypothetical protein